MHYNTFKPQLKGTLVFASYMNLLFFCGFSLIKLSDHNLSNHRSLIILIIIFGSLTILFPFTLRKNIIFFDDYFIIEKYFFLSKKVYYSDIIDFGTFSIILKKRSIIINDMENSHELIKILTQITTQKNIILENKQIEKEKYLNELNALSLLFATIISLPISLTLFIVLKIEIIDIPLKFKFFIIFSIFYIAIYYILKSKK